MHRFAGALAARLFAGRSGPADHRALAKHFERIHQHAAKSRAVAEQQRDRHDAPGNSRHGQKAAHRIASERGPRLAKYFKEHGVSPPPQSAKLRWDPRTPRDSRGTKRTAPQSNPVTRRKARRASSWPAILQKTAA